jgi:hypothetical protein
MAAFRRHVGNRHRQAAFGGVVETEQQLLADRADFFLQKIGHRFPLQSMMCVLELDPIKSNRIKV